MKRKLFLLSVLLLLAGDFSALRAQSPVAEKEISEWVKGRTWAKGMALQQQKAFSAEQRVIIFIIKTC